jgi:hypothetical protein
MPRRYTKEQQHFIREVAPGKYNIDIATLFNAKFGTDVTPGQIKSFKANYKIKSNVPKRRVTDDDGLFTKEQKIFIKNHVNGRTNQNLADLVNETFNLSITAKQIKNWKRNHGLSSGLKGSEGIAPPNKGTRGLYNVGGNKTSFKKGQKAHNYKPVGTERIDQDGYVLVKVSDNGAWHKRWRHKHKVIWEEANGAIPPGHVLLFLDGNSQNVTLDNLICISNSQLARMNQHHLIFNDPEMTKTGLKIAEIYKTIGERRKNAR